MHQRCANKNSNQLTHFAFLISGKRLKLKLYKCVCYQQIAVSVEYANCSFPWQGSLHQDVMNRQIASSTPVELLLSHIV